MLLIKLANGVPEGAPLIESNFRQLFPQTSFPSPLAAVDIAGTGYGLYETSQAPIAARYEKVEEAAAVEGEDGVWRQSWSVIDMTAEEKQHVDETQAAVVRSLRNAKLQACDWTQLADAPTTNATWSTYRQSLRDVPSQSGFPWNVTWPSEPV